MFHTGCVDACTVTTCSCTSISNYWSATSNALNPGFAWNVNFFDGFVFYGSNFDFTHVRAVRGSL